MRLKILFSLVVFAFWFPISTVSAAEEVCGACNLKILVSGQFNHNWAHGIVAVENAPRRESEAFIEGIFGTNFAVSIPNLDPGKYTAEFGFAETDLRGEGQRVFDIARGNEIIATNFDITVAAGGFGKVYILTNTFDFAGDSIGGPLTFTFTARKELAKLNTFELKDASGQSIVYVKAADLLDNEDSAALQPPVVTGPEIWKDPSQSTDARVKDLISRMSLAEKVAQMRNGAPAISRLGLPAYNYWNECLHGVARAGVATVFPQAIGLAATWDAPVMHEVGDVIADEARAKNNQYRETHNGDSARYFGLTFWTPNINIFRDPRWGRGQETYGEDPFLTGQMAVSFIQGLQGDDAKYLKAVACAKHFAVHSGPEPERHRFDAEPSERDLYETYLPQFEAAVREGHVGGVMGAYNSVNGEPACANPFLLTDLLRNQWGFDGYVTSDCGAIYDIFANHKFVATSEEAAAAAVKAGDDLCCGTDYDSLIRAVKKNLISEKEIDIALTHLLEIRFRLGLFDPANLVPFSQIPISENNSSEHEALALKTARESIVLLKNDGLLPLNIKKIKRIAVIGANADSVPVLLGNYNGVPSNPVTILNGIKKIVGTNIEVTFTSGCPLALLKDDSNRPGAQMLNDAVAAAQSADVVIYVGGISPRLEGEEMRVNYDGFNGGDRTRIELPELQTALLKKLKATGKPVIFVNCSGSAIAMPWEAENLPAIVQAWYPGEEGGRAMAEILFGDINPSGRLPITFYRSTSDLPGFEDYSMSNRTYRYFNGKPLFAFGHGLSYTRFKYRHVKLENDTIAANAALKLTFTVANTGGRDGDEVAQIYFRHKNSPVPQPKLALCAFQRVSLPRGQTQKVTIEIPARQFRYWDIAKKQYVVEAGDYELLVGAASNDIRAKTSFKIE